MYLVCCYIQIFANNNSCLHACLCIYPYLYEIIHPCMCMYAYLNPCLDLYPCFYFILSISQLFVYLDIDWYLLIYLFLYRYAFFNCTHRFFVFCLFLCAYIKLNVGFCVSMPVCMCCTYIYARIYLLLSKPFRGPFRFTSIYFKSFGHVSFQYIEKLFGTYHFYLFKSSVRSKPRRGRRRKTPAEAELF